MISHPLPLPGCTPEPLINYLKALGVFRLLSQVESSTRGAWQTGVFQLQTELEQESLLEFFLQDYSPTPIAVPWSGNDFFAVPTLKPDQTFKKTPTGSVIIAAFQLATAPRLQAYKQAIATCLATLSDAGIKNKEDMKKSSKSLYLSLLRSRLAGPAAEWVDAAAVILSQQPKFSVLLGSGGGSDGNTHFSDNFMQNVWEMLPDFDSQRPAIRAGQPTVKEISRSLLANALFAEPSEYLVAGRTSSLFDSGAVGGPNAGQGFERDALANPWNFILALEGAICLAGAPTRRFEKEDSQRASFPFQVIASPTGADSLAQKEEAGREVWLPEWQKPARYTEVRGLLAEGRLSNQRHPARTGVDAARAAASLGIDRGISNFNRYAIVKGRVGGDNYNTAAYLGSFPVRNRRQVDLLSEVDRWLTSFRKCCLEKESEEDRNKGNARFTAALRAIERAIVTYCRYGESSNVHVKDNRLFQSILIALGDAERKVSNGERFRTDRNTGRVLIVPLVTSSAEWITAVADDTSEFDLALALACIGRDTDKIGSHRDTDEVGPLRANLESFDWKARYPAWAEKDRSVVWNAADLSINLAAVFERRVMDAGRVGCKRLPLASRHRAQLSSVALFLAGETADERLKALIWALVLCPPTPPAGLPRPAIASSETPPLPREYALLKLLFLALPAKQSSASRLPAALYEKLQAIRPEPSVLPLLRSGQVADACRVALRRLRASGLMPLPHRTSSGNHRDDEWNPGAHSRDPRRGTRLAAALLFPITHGAIRDLCSQILRPETTSDETEAALQTLTR